MPDGETPRAFDIERGTEVRRALDLLALALQKGLLEHWKDLEVFWPQLEKLVRCECRL
jgi:hypothetical protein